MVLNNKLLSIRRILQNTRQFHSSRLRRGYEGAGKTTVEIINNTKHQLFINKCLPIGFKLNDNSLVIGPLAIFPNTLLSWNVGSGKDINEASLSLFTVVDPMLDLLIIGLETPYAYKRVLEMKKTLMKHKIKTEILPVEQACGVFNFLTNEGRYVAAGLIPPLPKKRVEIKKHTDNELIGDEKLIESK